MTTVSVRMDENLKRDFDEICNELGLSMTTAITMLAKKMTREKRIPFEVSMDPFYSASNMAALNDSIEEMRQGKTVTSTLEELEAMEHELDHLHGAGLCGISVLAVSGYKDAETDQRADKGYSEKPLPGDRQAGAAAGQPERLVEPPH